MATLLLYEVHAARAAPDAIFGGTQDNGAIVYRGTDWVIAGGGDAGDGFLRADDPGTGGFFEIISATGFLGLNGDVAVRPFAPGPCPRPRAGRFALDATDPSLVCAAGGSVHCSTNGGRDPWCTETADLGAEHLVIVDGSHAWASTDAGRVLRTTEGVAGAWTDATGDLPVRTVVGLDAPERGDPQRALVLTGSHMDPPRVYETTDGGGSWTPRGLPPAATTVFLAPSCLAPPCADTPEPGLQALSFAVTFAAFPRVETWWVGTDAGLLFSTDGGASWVWADGVPRARINDIDTYEGVVTVGTWGRGVWQLVIENRPPVDGRLPFEPTWWLRQIRVDVRDLWASELIARSQVQIRELRLLGTGPPRAFLRGDAPHGPHDFRVVAGQPLLVQGDAGGAVDVEAPAAASRPLRLARGWNPAGILGAALQTAGDVVADAAAQGLALGAVVDGSGALSYVPGAGGAGGQDFPLDPNDGHWLFACGAGGLWTPGAVEVAALAGAAAALAHDPAAHAGREGRVSGGQEPCPGFNAARDALAADLAALLPGEILVCLPEQAVSLANGVMSLCDSPPALETDERFDNTACDDKPQGRGCAVTVRLTGITEESPGNLALGFDAEARGTATLSQAGRCTVDATASQAVLGAEFIQIVNPPAIRHELVGLWPSLSVVQQGCGQEADARIASLVEQAIVTALNEEIMLRAAGIGRVCMPAVSLPDADQDGAPDCEDACPWDPLKVDPGMCGCGVVDDADNDGFAVCGEDCDDGNGAVWRRPGEVGLLTLSHALPSGLTTLAWSPPADLGGKVVAYDTLAAPLPSGFDAALCLESDDPSDTLAVTQAAPQPGQVLFFLVRAGNTCPAGDGSLGTGSDGRERSGRACP
jgi:hypothetical protein